MKLRRLQALVVKEARQAVRDPSSILIASVLPLLLLFLFGYGLSLDARRVALGVALEDDGAEARELAESFRATPYFSVTVVPDRRDLTARIVDGSLRGIVVIPHGFSRRVRGGEAAPVQVLTDGSETATAAYVKNYAQGVLQVWEVQRGFRRDTGRVAAQLARAGVRLQARLWFNPEVDSRHSLIPGSLTIILAIIGTLLTSLVVAREWERGTMESLLVLPLRRGELLLSKLLPYLALGLVSLAGGAAIAVFLFGVPFRGSIPALAATGGAFLLTALAQGLMISTLARNQFVASQLALISGFLPAFLLSGFVFEISSMPLPIQWLTRIIPARYLVTSLQSVFLAGDVWPLYLPMIGYLGGLAVLFLAITWLKMPRRVEG